MPRLGLTGSGNFRIVKGAYDETFSDFEHNTYNELVDRNIARKSPLADKNKVFVRGQHIRNTYTIFNLTKDEIDDILDLHGEVVLFTPRIDHGFSYNAIVENISINARKAHRITVTISLISESMQDPQTNITVTDMPTVQRGETYTIAWSSEGVTGNVDIELWKGSDIIKNEANAETNDGTYDMKAQKYAGLGNGANIKIDTGIACNAVDYLEVKLKYPTINATIRSPFGGIDGSPLQRMVCYMVTGTEAIGLGDTTAAIDFSGTCITGEIYTFKLTKNSATSYTLAIEDESGTEIFNETNASVTGTIATNNLYLFARNYSAGYSYYDAEIYHFTVNSETWYFKEGTGSTIEGNAGTDLTVSGTLTSFWTTGDLEIDTDYQIKVKNSTGYIYGFTNEFAVEYGGFVTPDGTDDLVATALTSLPDEYTIAFWYNGLGVARPNYDTILKCSPGTRPFSVGSDFSGNLSLFVDPALSTQIASGLSLPITNAWHSVIITCKHSTQTINFRVNGSTSQSVGSLPADLFAFDTLNWFEGADARAYKHLMITTGMSAADIANFEAGNISLVTNQIQWLKCNEASGNLADSSGNGNTGTPTNTDPTFYNQT